MASLTNIIFKSIIQNRWGFSAPILLRFFIFEDVLEFISSVEFRMFYYQINFKVQTSDRQLSIQSVCHDFFTTRRSQKFLMRKLKLRSLNFILLRLLESFQPFSLSKPLFNTLQVINDGPQKNTNIWLWLNDYLCVSYIAEMCSMWHDFLGA